MSRLSRTLALLALTTLLPAAPAAAGTFAVTSTADSGVGSLRTAIEAANLEADGDTISIEATGTIGLLTALPTLVHEVEIVGPGADSLTVRRAVPADFRIFTVGPSTAVAISGLTVADGRSQQGGGILSQGPLTLTRVVVSGNEAVTSGGSTAIASGGGIYASGPLTVRESTVSGNRAISSGGSTNTFAQYGGVFAFQAALFDSSTISGNTVEATSSAGFVVGETGGVGLLNGPATIERSTISGNSVTAAGGSPTLAKGGGVGSFSNALISGTTVTANSVTSTESASAANLNTFGTNLIRDTIVSAPQGAANCGGATRTSGGFNIEDGLNCEFALASDQSGLDPRLDPVLRANGGPTPTHALLPESPALDKGSAFGATTDQRGLPRPVDLAEIGNLEGGDGADIGAFELQAPSGGGSPGATAGGPGTVTLVAGDHEPPDTRVVKGPPRVTYKRLAKFSFVSTEQASFQCKVDKGAWQGCRSPFKRRVGAGRKHLFRVRAIDRFGNVDPSPARFGWRVKALPG
jgi:hypothetical protein